MEESEKEMIRMGTVPPDLIEFARPQIGLDGILILDLCNILISPKAHSQCRRPKQQYVPSVPSQIRMKYSVRI